MTISINFDSQDTPSPELQSVHNYDDNEVKSEDSEEPVIAEATSSADDTHILNDDCLSATSSNNFIEDNDYTDDIGSHVEISCEEMSKKWYQHEHDYLKNEPESSDIKDLENTFDNEIDCEIDNEISESYLDDADPEEYCNSNNIQLHEDSQITDSNSGINTYDAELPQEIFSMPVDTAMPQAESSGVIMTNYNSDSSSHVVQHQVIDSHQVRYNSAVILQEEKSVAFQHEMDVERKEVKEAMTFRGKISSISFK